MAYGRFWGGVLAITVAALAGQSWAAPLEAYGKLPTIEAAAIGPKGDVMAVTVTDGERREIQVRRIDTGRIIAGLGAGTIKIRDIQWAGSDHLIITSSVTSDIPFVIAPRSEWYVAFDFNIAKKTQRSLISGIDETLNVIDGEPQIRFIGGHPYAFVAGTLFVQGEGQRALFKVDLDHGDTAKVIYEGLPNTTDYVVDAKGDPLAESDYDAVHGRWILRVYKDGVWRKVERDQALIDTPSLLGLGRDGRSIAVAFGENKHSVVRELSPDGSNWSDPTPEPDMLLWDHQTYRWMGEASLVGDAWTYSFHDPRDQAIWKAITKAYPNSIVTLNSASDDHTRFLVWVDSPTDGRFLAYVDIATGQSEWIGDTYHDLKPADIAPSRSIAYKAKDGLALSGYLTLPKGKTARDLPLVVFPHGGPAARDEPGFDWWAQAMASRGYAVLQVNYRGSDGFGSDFLSAGFGEWGRKMQTDLSDGVRYLAKEGTIDPKRVCIVGASYGGYAALAGATLDPGVYRCAASIAGPSDLRRMVGDQKHRGGDQGVATERYWLRYMGPPTGLDDISPALQAAKATIPILLIHGKDDTVVPYVQSQIMADALRKAGKPVEFVTLLKEDHWLSRGETRLQMLQSVVAFLEKYNPAQ